MLYQRLLWIFVLVSALIGQAQAAMNTDAASEIGGIKQILLWRDAPAQLSLTTLDEARSKGLLVDIGQTQSIRTRAAENRTVWAVQITGPVRPLQDDLLLELLGARHNQIFVSQLPDYAARSYQLRSSSYRGILARFSLAIPVQQQTQSQWMFVEIPQPTNARLSIGLRLGAQLLRQEFAMARIHAIVATTMWVSVLAALLFFVTLREPIWLWYCATVALSALFIWMREAEWSGGGGTAANWQLRNLHYVFGCFSAAMTSAFMLRFMDDNPVRSGLSIWIYRFGALLCVLAISRLIMPNWPGSVAIANLIIIGLALMLSIIGIRRAWAGQKNAQILMLAYGCALLGVLLQALLGLGVGQRQVYMDLFFLVGFGVASMVLFLGLARSVLQVRLERDLAKLQASTDGLTGAFNHQAAQLEIVRQLTHASVDQPLAVCFVDLDLFKRVNDQFGHLVGDETLRQVVNVTRPILRGNDVFARWGGEEFIVVLPKTNAAVAREIAERIRSAIQSQCSMIGSHPVGATVSIGIAISTLCVEPADLLLDRADQALYRAKHAGRNRVVLADY